MYYRLTLCRSEKTLIIERKGQKCRAVKVLHFIKCKNFHTEKYVVNLQICMEASSDDFSSDLIITLRNVEAESEAKAATSI